MILCAGEDNLSQLIGVCGSDGSIVFIIIANFLYEYNNLYLAL